MKAKVDLPKSIDELKALDKDELKKLWLIYFDDLPLKADNKMTRALWHKIQCKSHKLRIEQKHITRLNRYSKDPDKYIEKSYQTKYHLRSGTEIIKTYKGKEYKVLIKSQQEFIYDNQAYNSISAVARAICNMKVSGYNFFGLDNSQFKNSETKHEDNL